MQTHVRERLHALLDRELPAAEEAGVRAHLERCRDCARAHAQLTAAVGAMRGLGRVRAPPGFAGRVLRQVRAERRPGRRLLDPSHKVPYEGGILVIIAAAIAAAIMASGLVEPPRVVAQSGNATVEQKR